MTMHGLDRGIHIVILDTILQADLLHDWSDLRVVGLDDSRKQVVGCLMVKSTREHSPEPAPCGIVLRCGNLKFSPEECVGIHEHTLLVLKMAHQY